MYSLNLPVSTLRTKIRQEFERHRYVNQLRTVDVLLFSSHQEYQVRTSGSPRCGAEFYANPRKGNAEFLEADFPRAQVLPRRRGTKREVAAQLHQRLFGGERSQLSMMKPC
jgi:hypothetical protein